MGTLHMPRHCRSGSPSAQRPPPALRSALPQITPHQHLHLLCDQNIVILSLIDKVGQHHWVEYTTANHPTVTQEAALCDCIGLHKVLLQIKFWDNGSSHVVRQQCNNKGIITVPHLLPALWTIEL
jgi:hypothetical protein